MIKSCEDEALDGVNRGGRSSYPQKPVCNQLYIENTFHTFLRKYFLQKKLKSNSNVLIFLMENLCLQEENWIECM